MKVIPVDIKKLRNEIDSIDDELVRLFEKRMTIASKVAEYKRENGIAVSDRSREREVMNKVTASVPPEFVNHVKSLYQTIFEHMLF